MTPTLGTRRTVTLTVIAFVVTLFAPLLTTTTTPTAGAATPITVAQAIAGQTGASATVRGYVVGQPTATNTVVTSNYPNDYALALADSATETSTSKMVYVQITSGFRATYGLRSNPSLKGQQLDVTGTLASEYRQPDLSVQKHEIESSPLPPFYSTFIMFVSEMQSLNRITALARAMCDTA